MLFNRKKIVDDIVVAAPCTADWDKMDGDNKVRFCSSCNLNVYNVSNMTRKEVASTLKDNGEKVCLKLYRRQDGTFITKDCPIGARLVRSVKQQARAVILACAALFNMSSLIEAYANDAPSFTEINSGASAGTNEQPNNLQKKEMPHVMGWVFAPNVFKQQSPSTQQNKINDDKNKFPDTEAFKKFREAFGKAATQDRNLKNIPSKFRTAPSVTLKQRSSSLPKTETYPGKNFYDPTVKGYPVYSFPHDRTNLHLPTHMSKPDSVINTAQSPAVNATALHSLVQAEDLADSGKMTEACQSYEAALLDFRKNDSHDPAFKKMVAKKYAQLLRRTSNETHAKEVESEFQITD